MQLIPHHPVLTLRRSRHRLTWRLRRQAIRRGTAAWVQHRFRSRRRAVAMDSGRDGERLSLIREYLLLLLHVNLVLFWHGALLPSVVLQLCRLVLLLGSGRVLLRIAGYTETSTFHDAVVICVFSMFEYDIFSMRICCLWDRLGCSCSANFTDWSFSYFQESFNPWLFSACYKESLKQQKERKKERERHIVSHLGSLICWMLGAEAPYNILGSNIKIIPTFKNMKLLPSSFWLLEIWIE